MIVRPTPDTSFDKYDEMRLHMERMKRVHLIELDLPLRILIPLEKIGVRRLGDLLKRTRADLLKAPNFGVSALSKVEATLDMIGFKLKQ